MAVSRIRCPECDTLVRPEEPVRAGKRIRCPSCDERFVVEEDDLDENVRSTGYLRRAEDDPRERYDRRSRREDYDDRERDRDDRPIRRPGSRRKRQEDSAIGLFVALTLVGILFLTGIGIGCYFIFRSQAPGVGSPAPTPDLGGPVDFPMPANGGGFPGNRPPNLGMNDNPFGGNPVGGNPGNPFGGQPSKISKENFARIKVGMPEAQVISILGPPTLVHDNFGGPNRKALHFTAFGGGIVTINNGVVESKLGG